MKLEVISPVDITPAFPLSKVKKRCFPVGWGVTVAPRQEMRRIRALAEERNPSKVSVVFWSNLIIWRPLRFMIPWNYIYFPWSIRRSCQMPGYSIKYILSMKPPPPYRWVKLVIFQALQKRDAETATYFLIPGYCTEAFRPFRAKKDGDKKWRKFMKTRVDVCWWTKLCLKGYCWWTKSS